MKEFEFTKEQAAVALKALAASIASAQVQAGLISVKHGYPPEYFTQLIKDAMNEAMFDYFVEQIKENAPENIRQMFDELGGEQ